MDFIPRFCKKLKHLKSQHILGDVSTFISKKAMTMPKISLSFKQL